MRTLRYLPLVALAGVDGFAMFLPYAVIVFAGTYMVARLRPAGWLATASA
jgi:hypothetical protein